MRLAVKLENIKIHKISVIVVKIIYFGEIAKIQKDIRVIKKMRQYPFQ